MFVCEEGTEVEDMFSYHGGVGGGHIPTFTVPISIGDVEVGVVICVKSVHGVQLGKLAEDFRRVFELDKCFAGFGVRRASGGVPECRVECPDLAS